MRTTFAGLAGLAILAGCSAANDATHQTATQDRIHHIYPLIAEPADQTAAINEWFEARWQERVARSPMTQTFLGIKDDYDKLDDPSLERQQEELEILRADVSEMRALFDYEALDPQAQLSWRILDYQYERAQARWPFRYHSYIFNQMFGAQSRIPAFMINQHRVASAEDADAYVARLNAVGDYLGTLISISDDAAERGIQPPAFVYDYVLTDARNVITGYPFGDAERDNPSPLYEDFKGKVDALKEKDEINGAKAATLITDSVFALRDVVGPAYERLIEAMEAQKATATTDDGVWKLPDGEKYYEERLAAQTTTRMSAEEIHQLGLDETARIHGEMRAIMQRVGFQGSLQDFFEFMRTDTRFYKPDTDAGRAAYIAEAEAMIEAMEVRLPEVFNRFPKADMIVKAVEPFRERSAGKAFYQRPSADGSRPGIYYANLYRMEDMPTYQMEALAFHEGIPGHHMQIAIQQELEGVPSFRRFSGVTAYSEGWGLYSEYLPKEMGFYTDPYSDFGRLAMELWRAARLVVDTGLHHKQWTREEAVDWLLENTPNPAGDAQKAIDRYIVMPGQATAYKIGMNKILELREHARTELGDAFDIRDFHDVILANGPVPLAILEENVETWIDETKAS